MWIVAATEATRSYFADFCRLALVEPVPVTDDVSARPPRDEDSVRGRSLPTGDSVAHSSGGESIMRTRSRPTGDAAAHSPENEGSVRGRLRTVGDAAVHSSPGDEGERDLVMVEATQMVPERLRNLRRITVATHSDLGPMRAVPDVTLPGGEIELLRLLSHALSPTSMGEKVVLVGAWHGGGGATTCAHALAKASRGVVIDAAGNRGGWVAVGEAATWGDLDVSDLPAPPALISALPRREGVPTLTIDAAAPVRPDDERVAAVVSALPRTAVVDCGVNLDALRDLAIHLEILGKNVAVVCAGKAGDHETASLARYCAADEGMPATFLVAGRPRPLLRSVMDRYDLRWRSAPRISAARRWSRVQGELWSR